MKRLQPLALTAASADEYKLRCRPKFDQISAADHADLLLIMRTRAINNVADEHDLESEFSFTFNENGSVLQDDRFFNLTGDDYGEMWINRAVGHFSRAHDDGIDVPDSPGGKLSPHALLVDGANTQSTRQYNVVFRKDSDMQTKEYTFTVEGGPGSHRTIVWMHGSYRASWAIHLELMPYAVT